MVLLAHRQQRQIKRIQTEQRRQTQPPKTDPVANQKSRLDEAVIEPGCNKGELSALKEQIEGRIWVHRGCCLKV